MNVLVEYKVDITIIRNRCKKGVKDVHLVLDQHVQNQSVFALLLLLSPVTDYCDVHLVLDQHVQNQSVFALLLLLSSVTDYCDVHLGRENTDWL
jgi:hypothetical protein